LQQLGLALDYSWTKQKTGTGYRLFEAEKARARTKKLAREYRRAAASELDQQLQLTFKYLDKYREMAPRDVIADINRLREQSEQLPLGRERLAAEWELFAAERAHEPTVKAMITAYAALPEALREQILDGRRVTMATLRPADVRMPAEVLTALRASRQFEAVRGTRGAEVPDQRQTDDEVIEFLTGKHFGRLVLQIRGRKLGNLRARPNLSLPTFMLSPSQVTFGTPLADNAPGQVVADDPKALDQRIAFQWPVKKRVKEDPLSFCGSALLADVLKLLAEQAPTLNFVGDTYFKALRPLPRAQGIAGPPVGHDPATSALARLSARAGREGALPFGELLRELSQRGNTNIHVTREGWVRLRSTTYFDDRATLVDPQLVKELYGGIAAGEPYTATTALQVAGRLTFPQVDLLTTDYLGFFSDIRPVQRMRGSWDSWRLLGKLTEERRRLLLARQDVPYTSLDASERKAVQELIDGVSSRIIGEALHLDVGPRELTSLRLTLGAPGPNSSDPFELWLPGFKHPLLQQTLQVRSGALSLEKAR
ncbi:MAG: hypothetical protein K0Q72_2382, partial [Armatimonadetes bacterium]|nr:hypothetical protein [Armatimonadota bacterium]